MSWFTNLKNRTLFSRETPESSNSFLLVGLGNPGDKYVGTRHNLGRDFLLDFVTRNSLDLSDWQKNSKFDSLVSEGQIAGKRVVLLLPETFMNLSGKAVIKYLNFTKTKPTLIVVHDDVDLPLGTIRLSTDSGAGGHNGVASIIDSLGTKHFMRLRLGIGRSSVIPTDKFVLEDFTEAEQQTVQAIFADAKLALEKIVTTGGEGTRSEGN